MPKKPQDVRVLKKGENISLLWAPPEESLFKIDRYKIEYSTDTLTNPPVYVSAESVKYVVKDSIGHDIYRFTICACSHGIEGEKAVGGHQSKIHVPYSTITTCVSPNKVRCKHLKWYHIMSRCLFWQV